MFGPLKTLFDVLLSRRIQNARFAQRLHPRRTVFLHELIADIRDPARIALLAAPWLDLGRLTARIAATCVFLDKVARVEGVQGWEGMPLVFFQSGSEAEDARQRRELLARDASGRYAERFAHLPPGVRYLHTRANFSAYMQGRWKGRTLVVAPHSGFAPDRDLRGYNPPSGTFYLQTLGVGYRLTDYPRLLDVGPIVATDYFARIVVHDLCHYFLPSTPHEAEGFHNAASLMAMGELPPIAYASGWERFIHRECTDPAFCLEAGSEIEAVLRSVGVLSPVQEDLLKSFRAWYLSKGAFQKREAWNLAACDREALRARIDEARADGFRLYIRLMPDA